MKRASDYAKQKSGLGDYEIVSLHGSELFGQDYTIEAYEMLEGEHGEFANILVTGQTPDHKFIISSGSAAVIKTLRMIDEGDGFPCLGQFGRKMGKNKREYYTLG